MTRGEGSSGVSDESGTDGLGLHSSGDFAGDEPHPPVYVAGYLALYGKDDSGELTVSREDVRAALPTPAPLPINVDHRRDCTIGAVLSIVDDDLGPFFVGKIDCPRLSRALSDAASEDIFGDSGRSLSLQEKTLYLVANYLPSASLSSRRLAEGERADETFFSHVALCLLGKRVGTVVAYDSTAERAVRPFVRLSKAAKTAALRDASETEALLSGVKWDPNADALGTALLGTAVNNMLLRDRWRVLSDRRRQAGIEGHKYLQASLKTAISLPPSVAEGSDDPCVVCKERLDATASRERQGIVGLSTGVGATPEPPITPLRSGNENTSPPISHDGARNPSDETAVRGPVQIARTGTEVSIAGDRIRARERQQKRVSNRLADVPVGAARGPFLQRAGGEVDVTDGSDRGMSCAHQGNRRVLYEDRTVGLVDGSSATIQFPPSIARPKGDTSAPNDVSTNAVALGEQEGFLWVPASCYNRLVMNQGNHRAGQNEPPQSTDGSQGVQPVATPQAQSVSGRPDTSSMSAAFPSSAQSSSGYWPGTFHSPGVGFAPMSSVPMTYQLPAQTTAPAGIFPHGFGGSGHSVSQTPFGQQQVAQQQPSLPGHQTHQPYQMATVVAPLIPSHQGSGFYYPQASGTIAPHCGTGFPVVQPGYGIPFTSGPGAGCYAPVSDGHHVGLEAKLSTLIDVLAADKGLGREPMGPRQAPRNFGKTNGFSPRKRTHEWDASETANGDLDYDYAAPPTPYYPGESRSRATNGQPPWPQQRQPPQYRGGYGAPPPPKAARNGYYPQVSDQERGDGYGSPYAAGYIAQQDDGQEARSVDEALAGLMGVVSTLQKEISSLKNGDPKANGGQPVAASEYQKTPQVDQGPPIPTGSQAVAVGGPESEQSSVQHGGVVQQVPQAHPTQQPTSHLLVPPPPLPPSKRGRHSMKSGMQPSSDRTVRTTQDNQGQLTVGQPSTVDASAVHRIGRHRSDPATDVFVEQMMSQR